MQHERIIDLTPQKVRDYLLKNSSYTGILLPEYFDFTTLIEECSIILKNEGDITKCFFQYGRYKNANKQKKNQHKIKTPRQYDGVNCIIINNKDGKNAWRPFSLIHPLLYVDIVNTITNTVNWKKIRDHLKAENLRKIRCTSIPVVSKSDTSKEQIIEWWEEFEQESIRLSAKYNFLIKTDIANCYNSIYTHSIEWALYGREESKRRLINKTKKSTKKNLGKVLDEKIRGMQYGQTNGIPQGSVLCDLIAEIVLRRIDCELEKVLTSSLNFVILRFRDDYRIFSDSEETAGKVLRELGSTLRMFGLSLNSKKTIACRDLIKGAFKEDKWALLNSVLSLSLYNFNYNIAVNSRISCMNIQKLLLQIYNFSTQHPNSGQLRRILVFVYRLISHNKHRIRPEVNQVYISILLEIAFANPLSCPQAIAAISFLISILNRNERKEAISNIRKKYANLSNTDYLDIWMQRMLLPHGYIHNTNNKLCNAVASQPNNKIWNSAWLMVKYRNIINSIDVINRNIVKSQSMYVLSREVDSFSDRDDS